MTGDQRQQITDLLARAQEEEPGNRRALVEGSGATEEVKREVCSLLDHLEREVRLREQSRVTPATDPPPAPLPDRFDFRQLLGEGNFGSVYWAYDHLQGADVAVKVLREDTVANVQSLKREFRALAGMNHRNLVRFHELLQEGRRWLLVMELVRGESLLRHVRSAGDALHRLRHVLAQLVDGLNTLHRAGVLHLDLKPANVLVDSKGRVVIVDLGLARRVRPDASWQTQSPAGTPAYMSPEQFGEQELTPASDWYSLGAMLYQALCGRLPFPSESWATAFRKCHEPAPLDPLRESGAPEDLASLCADLLRIEPARRPTGEEVAVRLGLTSITGGLPPSGILSTLVVGRETELALLHDALRRADAGEAVLVRVRGPSGMGKSTILRHFLSQVRQSAPEAVLLSGRCYERESVPFKGLDEAIERLARYLRRLPPDQAAELLPRDAPSLLRLFPVLRRVEAFDAARLRVPEPRDSQERRARAFGALKELLARLADRRPVVLCIDDLQWGDADGVALLEALLAPPSPPSLMLMVGYRDDARPLSPALRSFLRSDPELPLAAHVVDVPVGPLTPGESRQLATLLLPDADEPEVLQQVARETGGDPFLIGEWAGYLRQRGNTSDALPLHGLRLRDILQHRIGQLEDAERQLLQVFALAAQPISGRSACRAAGLPGESGALPRLLRERLLRAHGAGADGLHETFHDQVREAALALLSADETQQLHYRLAVALESEDCNDLHRLVHHFQAAGNRPAAYGYAVSAARQAEQGLAFERAIRLYRLALRLRAEAPEEIENGTATARLQRGLADALANAGECAEAAQVYLQAAEGAAWKERRLLWRQAADQLLRSGATAQGIDLLRRLVRHYGIAVPERSALVMVGVLWNRVRTRWRGLSHRERAEDGVPPSDLQCVDDLWAAAAMLVGVDLLLATYLQGQHILRALECGEPGRVALGLSIESIYRAAGGERSREEARGLLDQARELAKRVGHALPLASCDLAEAGIGGLTGHWREMEDAGRSAEELLRTQCRGVSWEIALTRVYRFGALTWQGRWREIAEVLPGVLEEARRRGELHAEAGLPLASSAFLIHLAADEPEQVVPELERSLGHWSGSTFGFARYSRLVAEVETLLFQGEGALARRRLLQDWRALPLSPYFYMEITRLQCLHLRARCALAACGNDRRLLSDAERAARRCERTRSPLGIAYARAVQAGVAMARGDRPAAATLFHEAKQLFAGLHMLHYAAACQRRWGESLSGRDGAALVRDADNTMRRLGATNPVRMTNMLTPGAS